MVDVDCAVGAAPCLTPAEDSGYEVDEAEVIYWGRCPECLAEIPIRSRDEEQMAPDLRNPQSSDGNLSDRAKAHDQSNER